jgi:hypothetical protein
LKSAINYLFRFYLFFVPDVPIVKDLSDGGKEHGETGWHIPAHWNFIGLNKAFTMIRKLP